MVLTSEICSLIIYFEEAHFFGIFCFLPTIKVFAHYNKVFARLLGKAALSKARSFCRAPQSAKSPLGVFFLISFLLRRHVQKKKRKEHLIFSFGYMLYFKFHGRGKHRSPLKILKVTFLLLALFTDEKRGKSHIRSFLPYVSSPHLPAMLYSNNHRPPVRT